MSVTITAVPTVSAETVPPPATDVPSEQPLFDLVAASQQSPAADAAHLANPAALASEVVGGLRGFFERAQGFERGRISLRPEGTNEAALTPAADEPRLDLHGGPAREPLEPVEGEEVSAPVAVSLAQLQRAMDLALASMNFATETALVVRGTSQISHSANTLLRGQ